MEKNTFKEGRKFFFKIDTLPHEVLCEVFSFLKPNKILQQSLVCHRFHQAVTSKKISWIKSSKEKEDVNSFDLWRVNEKYVVDLLNNEERKTVLWERNYQRIAVLLKKTSVKYKFTNPENYQACLIFALIMFVFILIWGVWFSFDLIKLASCLTTGQPLNDINTCEPNFWLSFDSKKYLELEDNWEKRELEYDNDEIISITYNSKKSWWWGSDEKIIPLKYYKKQRKFKAKGGHYYVSGYKKWTSFVDGKFESFCISSSLSEKKISSELCLECKVTEEKCISRDDDGCSKYEYYNLNGIEIVLTWGNTVSTQFSKCFHDYDNPYRDGLFTGLIYPKPYLKGNKVVVKSLNDPNVYEDLIRGSSSKPVFIVFGFFCLAVVAIVSSFIFFIMYCIEDKKSKKKAIEFEKRGMKVRSYADKYIVLTKINSGERKMVRVKFRSGMNQYLKKILWK